MRLWVAGARGHSRRHHRFETEQIRFVHDHIAGRHVLLKVTATLGSRNRNHVITLRHDPGEGKLTGRAPLLLGELANAFDQCEVPGEILDLEPRVVASEVIFAKVGRALDGAGQESPAQRAEGDYANPEGSGNPENLRLQVARPKRPLAL